MNNALNKLKVVTAQVQDKVKRQKTSVLTRCPPRNNVPEELILLPELVSRHLPQEADLSAKMG